MFDAAFFYRSQENRDDLQMNIFDWNKVRYYGENRKRASWVMSSHSRVCLRLRPVSSGEGALEAPDFQMSNRSTVRCRELASCWQTNVQADHDGS